MQCSYSGKNQGAVIVHVFYLLLNDIVYALNLFIITGQAALLMSQCS